MTLEEAIKHVQNCQAKMDQLYGGVVFDEWIVLQISGTSGSTLYYDGPRRGTFKKSFGADVKDLYPHLRNHAFSPGDFEFSRGASGTAYESVLVMGNQIYLLCNHTSRTMEEIVKNPKWLGAQVPFTELADEFRRDPLKTTQGK